MGNRPWAIKVTGRIPGSGTYVPLGPVGEGDYHKDLYATHIITAGTLSGAKKAFMLAYPGADRIKAKRLITVD